MKDLKYDFKRAINWNKYQPRVSPKRQNQYLDFLIDSRFQSVKRRFVLSFENEAQRTKVTNDIVFRLEN